MKKYLNYVNEFQESNEFGLYFINNQLKKHLIEHKENQTEIEHILDYLYSEKKIFKIGYKTILEKADKWNKRLQQQSVKDIEVLKKDYKIVKDFKDGFKFVKLLSKEAYNREGKLMSHCVSSYYERDDEIYSLRDKKNNPHCTISKSSQQIKGKGNGKICPKYIKYVVGFLEFLEIDVRDSGMENLGYVNISNIKDKNAVFPNLFRKKYFYAEDIDKIVDKKGNKYQSLKMWDAFGLIDNSGKILFDIELCLSNSENSSSGYRSKNASSGDYSKNTSSGDYSQNASSGDCSKNASSGYRSRNASSGDYSENSSSGDGSQNASSGDYSKNASSGDYSQNASSGDCSKNASPGYRSQNASSGDYSENSSSGDGSQNASSGDYSKNIMKGRHSVSADSGANGKAKGAIGCWFCLTEWKDSKPIHMEAFYIDGKKIKENTFYTLENKKLIESK